jgi:pyruvate dehydrogenase E2 component (dihydrolipoamide acetyltransferase)
MSEFRMPSLGADMESGTLVEWLKKPGEPVHRGDIVAVVETQKGAIEVEIFVNGVMGEQLVPLGTTVPVGTPLAIIKEAGEPLAAPAAREIPPPPPATTVAPSSPRPAAPPSPVTGIKASPAARKAAADTGVKLETIRGTGPDGAITLRDVELASGKAEAKPPSRALDLDKMREAIAAAMARSKREIPHYYLATEVDMTRAVAWLEQNNADRPPNERLLPAVLTLKATALAVRKYPSFNGTYSSPEGFSPSKPIHVGTAIAIRGGGLVAPAIHDCDQMDLQSLMAHLRDLVSRARIGRLRSSEISDSTITVSSLGERGVDSLFGIIYPPQVAILGFGRMVRKPVAIGDEVQVRPVMAGTLAADHRVTDGHLGSLFLNEIALLLQEPERL